MAKRRPDLLVGLDIGTTEIRCLIGVRPTEDNKKFHILGLGCAVNEGMRAGVITNYEEVVGAVDSAIKQAELNAGHRVEALTANINGAHLKASLCQAEVAVSNSERIVKDFDRDLVDRKAKEQQSYSNRSIIQFLPNTYRVDQVQDLANPVGIKGNVLGVKALIVTGLKAHVDSLESVCHEVGVEVNQKTVSSLAAAEAVFDKESIESGVVVVDIGHSTTNIVILRAGKIEHIAVIPLGGFNITKDIAIILQVDLDVAEFLKINHANLGLERRGTKTVEYKNQSVIFSPQDLSEVIAARCRDICEFIEQILNEKGLNHKLAGGVILTGGSARIKGLEMLFQEHLKMYTRLGELKNFGGLVEIIENKPEYLTVAGILALDYILQVNHDHRYALEKGFDKGLGLFNLFRGRFKRKRKDFKPEKS